MCWVSHHCMPGTTAPGTTMAKLYKVYCSSKKFYYRPFFLHWMLIPGVRSLDPFYGLSFLLYAYQLTIGFKTKHLQHLKRQVHKKKTTERNWAVRPVTETEAAYKVLRPMRLGTWSKKVFVFMEIGIQLVDEMVVESILKRSVMNLHVVIAPLQNACCAPAQHGAVAAWTEVIGVSLKAIWRQPFWQSCQDYGRCRKYL